MPIDLNEFVPEGEIATIEVGGDSFDAEICALNASKKSMCDANAQKGNLLAVMGLAVSEGVKGIVGLTIGGKEICDGKALIKAHDKLNAPPILSKIMAILSGKVLDKTNSLTEDDVKN